MTHLYLIRHARYVHNQGEKLLDPVLSPEGRAQAERLRDRLSATGEIKADALVASTMLRAKETAEIIAPALGLPIVPDDDAQEWRNMDGTYTVDDFVERMKATPYHQKAFFAGYPGGETWAQFMLRACAALNRITQEYAGKTVVVVCHGGVIEASFLFFCGLSTLQPPPIVLDPDYTSITHWQKTPGETREWWLLERFNDAAHLRE